MPRKNNSHSPGQSTQAGLINPIQAKAAQEVSTTYTVAQAREDIHVGVE